MLKGTPQCWAVQHRVPGASVFCITPLLPNLMSSAHDTLCSSVLSVMHSATQLSGLLLIGQLCAFPKVTEVNHFCIVPKPLMCWPHHFDFAEISDALPENFESLVAWSILGETSLKSTCIYCGAYTSCTIQRVMLDRHLSLCDIQPVCN